MDYRIACFQKGENWLFSLDVNSETMSDWPYNGVFPSHKDYGISPWYVIPLWSLRVKALGAPLIMRNKSPQCWFSTLSPAASQINLNRAVLQFPLSRERALVPFISGLRTIYHFFMWSEYFFKWNTRIVNLYEWI